MSEATNTTGTSAPTPKAPTAAEFQAQIQEKAKQLLLQCPLDTDDPIPKGCRANDVCIGQLSAQGNRCLDKLLAKLRGQKRCQLLEEPRPSQSTFRFPKPSLPQFHPLYLDEEEDDTPQQKAEDALLLRMMGQDQTFLAGSSALEDEMIVQAAMDAIQEEGARFMYSKDYSAPDPEFEVASAPQAALFTKTMFRKSLHGWSGLEADESLGDTDQRCVQLFRRALENYERFHDLPRGSVVLCELEGTSAGIQGWATTAPPEEGNHEATSAPFVDPLQGLPPDDPRLLELIRKAMRNYERYHGSEPGSATYEVLERTSAGILGWAAASDIPNEDGDSTTLDNNSEQPPPPPPTSSHRPRRRGEQEEDRELQFALLESVGAKPARPETHS